MSHQRWGKRSTKDGLLLPDLEYDACQAVRAGNMVFLVGLTGISADSSEFIGAGDPAAQAETAMLCVKTLLEEAGSKLEHICKTTIYITDRTYREEVYKVIGKHLKGIHVCSTGLIVKGLARPEMVMEIDVEAIIPDNES